MVNIPDLSQIAKEELLRRPETKKLMVVLSDGMPAEASAGYTKAAIEDTRKAGIKLYGIFFDEYGGTRQQNQFLDMYGQKDAVCCKPSEIDKNLTALLKKFSRS